MQSHKLITLSPRGTTYVKTYVTMCDQRISKWTHISEVHGYGFTSFSEPLHDKPTLISEERRQTLDPILSTKICHKLDTHISEVCRK